jgi:hypothetical protein
MQTWLTYLPYLFAVLFLGLSIMLFVGVWRAIKKGEVAGRGCVTYRYSSPFAFWLQMVTYAAFGIFLLLASLACCHLAPQWFTALLASMNSH